jgi:CubicO group peptidase (beta-lactamase class C family)
VAADELTYAQETAITGMLRAQQRLTRTPGLALIVRRHGQVVYARGLGVDGDGAPFTINTRAYLGSLSKSFTALAVMQLVVAGRVELDAPVRTYLTDFQLQDPRGARITVRHLLQQKSGLTDANLPDWTLPWPRNFAESTRRVHAVKELTSEPGTQHAYHNANYMLLGDLVGRVSGESLGSYLQRHVFTPIQMRSAGAVSWMDERADGVSPGYVFVLGKPIALRAPSFFIGGAGGVFASAADLSTWLEVFAGNATRHTGTALLPSPTIAAMLTPETEDPYQYQYGWVVRQHGTQLIRHNGGLPTFTAHAAFAADDSISIAFVANSSPANPAWTQLGQDVADGVVAILEGRVPSIKSTRVGVRVEACFLAFTILMLAFCAVLVRRARRWRSRANATAGGTALFLLYLRATLLPSLTALAIFVGLPMVVSLVESWSWLWLLYFSPVITVCLWVIGLSAAAVIVARCRHLLAQRLPRQMAL